MDLNIPGSTLRDYIRIIFRRKAVIITSFITVTMGVLVGLELKTPMYEAQVKMLISAVKKVESPYYLKLSGYQDLTQSEIVNSNPVIERAVKVLKLYERPIDYEKNFCSPLKAWLMDLRHKMSKSDNISLEQEQANILQAENPGERVSVAKSEQEQANCVRWAVVSLKGKTKVETIPDSDLFTISVSDFSPDAAATIANVISRSYVIFDLEQQMAELQLQYGEMHPIVVQLRNGIDKTTRNLTGETLPAIEAIGPASVKIIEQAQEPFEPAGISKRVTLLLALVMSVFLGIMLAFGFEYLDHTFKSPQEVETFLNLPLLGSIPKKGFKDGVLIKDSKRTEAFTQPYQNLSDQIYL